MSGAASATERGVMQDEMSVAINERVGFMVDEKPHFEWAGTLLERMRSRKATR